VQFSQIISGESSIPSGISDHGDQLRVAYIIVGFLIGGDISHA
jgi:hypothetical protein